MPAFDYIAPHTVHEAAIPPSEGKSSSRRIGALPGSCIAGLLHKRSIGMDRHLPADEPGPLPDEVIAAGGRTERRNGQDRQPDCKYEEARSR